MPRLAFLLMAAVSLSAAPQPYVPTEGGSVPLNLFQVPEGLEVTVWARSPMLANPTNLDIDAQGRVWVTEGVNYRVYNKGGKRRPEGDRVVYSATARAPARPTRPTPSSKTRAGPLRSASRSLIMS